MVRLGLLVAGRKDLRSLGQGSGLGLPVLALYIIAHVHGNGDGILGAVKAEQAAVVHMARGHGAPDLFGSGGLGDKLAVLILIAQGQLAAAGALGEAGLHDFHRGGVGLFVNGFRHQLAGNGALRLHLALLVQILGVHLGRDGHIGALHRVPGNGKGGGGLVGPVGVDAEAGDIVAAGGPGHVAQVGPGPLVLVVAVHGVFLSGDFVLVLDQNAPIAPDLDLLGAHDLQLIQLLDLAQGYALHRGQHAVHLHRNVHIGRGGHGQLAFPIQDRAGIAGL